MHTFSEGIKQTKLYIVAIFSSESSNYFLSCESGTNDQSF